MSDKKGRYKYCIVPECKNTSIITPDKIFISLPSDLKARELWQQAMRRTAFVSSKGTHFCCEDHFNLEEDLENYRYISTMKTGKIILKLGVVPHIFECQNGRPTCHTPKPRKRKREIENSLDFLNDRVSESQKKSVDVGTQVNLQAYRRSKATQTLNITSQKKRRSKKIENAKHV